MKDFIEDDDGHNNSLYKMLANIEKDNARVPRVQLTNISWWSSKEPNPFSIFSIRFSILDHKIKSEGK